jgi:hypothetical protein
MFRNEALEDMSFLAFHVETYEERLRAAKDSGQPQVLLDAAKLGRPRNIRAPYQSAHPRSSTFTRVMRSRGHRNLPNIVGPWFVRNDDPQVHDLYQRFSLSKAMAFPGRAKITRSYMVGITERV